MHIRNIALTNYRNHKKFSCDFSPDKNLILGANGTGKTNILEAIHLLSTTKPFRACYDRDVIHHNETFSRIESHIESTAGEDKLELMILKSEQFENACSKKAKTNGVTKTMQQFSTALKTVLFSPEDIDMLTDSPAERRRYIDLVLVQTNIDYKRALAQYVKAVKQRNKILELMKEEGRGYDQIEYWDKEILKNGTMIQKARRNLFDFVNMTIGKHADVLDESLTLEVTYKPNLMSIDRIETYKNKEMMAKSTLIGPHRDDFSIELNKYNMAQFSSRGQQRAALLALKLTEIDFFSLEPAERPVLLLDDIFSELDEKHKAAVFKVIEEQQTIITSTESLPGLDNCNEILLDNLSIS